MMMKDDVTRSHIDRMIDRALHGEYIPYPVDEDFNHKVWELSKDPTTNDPEQLRAEGYRILDEQTAIFREYGLA